MSSGDIADTADQVEIEPKKRRERSPLSKVFHFFASFGMAVVLLLFLFLLTWLGTLEQITEGLYDTQAKYFESLFLVHEWDIWGMTIPIPLPGGYLVLALLFVNLFCGGIIRIRKSWRTPGVITAHLAILLMIAAGGVEFSTKREGNMRLWNGDSSNFFESYHTWIVEVRELGKDDVLIIRDEEFNDRDGSKSRTFHHASLPFDLRFSGYVRNAIVEPAAKRADGDRSRVIDGFYAKSLPLQNANEQNVGAVIVDVMGTADAPIAEGHLSGFAFHPLTFESEGKTYSVSMTRERWQTPFKVRLDEFIHEIHPGTNKPKNFQSNVTIRPDTEPRAVEISMNEPLRHDGYTFFQASWGPPDAGPDDEKYTVFAVVNNPSDRWPEIACWTVLAGLLFHFVQKLYLFLGRSTKAKQPKATS